ncbi:MAG: caspase family protein, partial [Bacteroidales bacterium]|nr:caspase family protein [Bacteroidales bacterium]
NTNAQSAKKLLRQGNKQLKENQVELAKSSLTLAIQTDPNMVDAYISRANAYALLGENDKAITDLDIVNKLEPKNEESWLRNANLNYSKEDYKKASVKYASYLELEEKDLSIYSRQIQCLMIIEDYQQALTFAKKKQGVDETAQGFYEVASLEYILKNYTAAEANYKKAIAENKNNIDYHNGLAHTLFDQKKYDACIFEANEVLRRDKNNKKAYLSRAKSYHKKIDYPSAIDDMSKIIVLYSSDDDFLDNLNYRGDLFLEFSQRMNAISDYSRVIGKDQENTYALYKRSIAYEGITRSDEAIEDLTTIIAIAGGGAVVSESILSESKTKLYSLKKESDDPEISIISDYATDNTIKVTFDKTEIEINIKVEDENSIESLTVDGEEITIGENSGLVNVFHTIILTDKEKISITSKDTYGNQSTAPFYIQRVENDAPIVNFSHPYAKNNELILDATDESRVYFTGNINDQSLIKNVFIDDVLVSFNRQELNPGFENYLNLEGKTKITIKVTDIYDNVLEEEYYLNREQALYAADSPMGKTWIVFLENSDYTSFAPLEGPGKDVELMKTALANYEVHNVIHKKDFTKTQMERFFRIELRDLIKGQNINSLVIWYAGHGKFQNETGYWIPVDATRNDEFSYYSISNLKASMQIYAGDLTHTLVITDACESGPSFYQAMRSDVVVRECGDESAIKFKSSQVFSSAGYELASDNSQFTKTFANSLVNNSDACIPIERIVLNVENSINTNEQQKPQFGKIAGLEDENGSFFFIKRSSATKASPKTGKTEGANPDEETP